MSARVDVETVLDRVVELWEELAAPELRPNCCIVAAVEASAVLRYFGLDARPVACDVAFHNAEAWDLVGRGIPVSEWPPSAWSVGSSHDDPADRGYRGHLVTIVDEGPTKILLDLTARQYARPDRGIEIREPMTLRTDADLDVIAAISRDDTVRAIYRLRPDRQSWRSTPDGRASTRWAGEMIRRIRSEVGA